MSVFSAENPGVFHQAINDTSATAKHRLGTIRQLEDGRQFVYCLAGGTALVAGDLQQSAATVANHEDMPISAAISIGATTITGTSGATAASANDYAEGYCIITDDTGEGYTYKISGNPAWSSAGTFTVNLYDSIKVALGASATVTLISHPCWKTVAAPTTVTGPVVGVAPVAVTAAYYYWAQTHGTGAVATEGTLADGEGFIRSITTAGAVTGFVNGTDTTNQPILGTFYTAPTAGEKAAVMLNIPGF